MNRNQVIETAFETIRESTEWGIDEEGKIYGNWVDGVIAMTNNLLDKINEENKRPLVKK